MTCIFNDSLIKITEDRCVSGDLDKIRSFSLGPDEDESYTCATANII